MRHNTSSAYAKVERRVGDWAVHRGRRGSLTLDGDAIAAARVGLTAVNPDRAALAELAASLVGKPATEETFAEAGRLPHEPATRSTDVRGTAEYKRHLAAELTIRTLRTAAERVRTCRRELAMQVNMTVNGEPVSADVEPRLLLVHFLRDQLRLTGTHWGCDTSNCGTCVVDVDGVPVKSCTMLAVMASGHSVRTIEGLAGLDGSLDPVQEGFMRCHGLQCGFCTPGMMITARALLDRDPDPDEETIREAISGQICRCTGYTTIVRSIQWAAQNAKAEAEA